VIVFKYLRYDPENNAALRTHNKRTRVLGCRFVLHEKMVVGFANDLAWSLQLIFKRLGWPWDTRRAPPAVTNGRPKDQAAVMAAATAPFLARIARDNAADVKLYAEARNRYDERKTNGLV
jgi:hypothetical protein